MDGRLCGADYDSSVHPRVYAIHAFSRFGRYYGWCYSSNVAACGDGCKVVASRSVPQSSETTRAHDTFVAVAGLPFRSGIQSYNRQSRAIPATMIIVRGPHLHIGPFPEFRQGYVQRPQSRHRQKWEQHSDDNYYDSLSPGPSSCPFGDPSTVESRSSYIPVGARAKDNKQPAWARSIQKREQETVSIRTQ